MDLRAVLLLACLLTFQLGSVALSRPLDSDQKGRTYYQGVDRSILGHIDESALFLHLHYHPEDVLSRQSVTSESLKNGKQGGGRSRHPIMSVDRKPLGKLVGFKGILTFLFDSRVLALTGAASAAAQGVVSAWELPTTPEAFERFASLCEGSDIAICRSDSLPKVGFASILESASQVERLELALLDRRTLDANPENVLKPILILAASLEEICNLRLISPNTRSEVSYRDCENALSTYAILTRLVVSEEIHFVFPQDRTEDARALLWNTFPVPRTYDHSYNQRIRGTKEVAFVNSANRFLGEYWDLMQSLIIRPSIYASFYQFDGPDWHALHPHIWLKVTESRLGEQSKKKINSFQEYLEFVNKNLTKIDQAKKSLEEVQKTTKLVDN